MKQLSKLFLVGMTLATISTGTLAQAASLEQRTTECKALLGGMLGFKFNPSASGSIHSVDIIPPEKELTRTIPVKNSFYINESQLRDYFPLKAGESYSNFKFEFPLHVVVAQNHNGYIENFVWGARDARTNQPIGVLLHDYGNGQPKFPIRFGNCTVSSSTSQSVIQNEQQDITFETLPASQGGIHEERDYTRQRHHESRREFRGFSQKYQHYRTAK